MLTVNFGSDVSELDNMVKDDMDRMRVNIRGLEATRSTIEEHVQLLEKDITRYESAIRTLEEKKIRQRELAQDIDMGKQGCSKIGQIISPHFRAEHMEKKYDDLKSRLVTGSEIDDTITDYQDLLQDCKYTHTYFAHTLLIYERVYRDQCLCLHALLSKFEALPVHNVPAKRAKKGTDEPTVPSASVPARVERPSSPSY